MKTKKRRTLQGWEQAQLAKYEAQPWRIHDWYEEVSSIVIHPMFGEPIKFQLTAFGFGYPPQEHLRISVVGLPHTQFTLGVDGECLKELGQWCIECIYLLDSLREKKQKQAAKLRKQLAEVHEAKGESEWKRKAAK